MSHFSSYDGTVLAYQVLGAGAPLVCVPGGPARAGSYLGDLGGLGAQRTLLVLDHRGTGGSAAPDDPASYRAERIVDDLEAFRGHLGLARMDLLAHSAGATVAQLYAARFPDRVSRLVLVTPSLRGVGLEPVGFDEAVAARSDQWWYQAAVAALGELRTATARGAGFAETAALRLATAPLWYGRWDEHAAGHHAAGVEQSNEAAAEAFYADFAPDFPAVRAALAKLDVPVLVVAGAVDPAPTPAAARQLADLFPHAEVVVQEKAGHYPFVDGPAIFSRTVAAFLAGR